MQNERTKLKTVHFFFCWILTVILGSILPAFIGDEFEFILLFMAVAAIFSAPFLIIFLIIIHYELKKKPSRKALHRYVFLIHFIGSIATVLVLMVSFSYDVQNNFALFAGLVGGYFLIDSLLFHTIIASFYPKQPSTITE